MGTGFFSTQANSPSRSGPQGTQPKTQSSRVNGRQSANSTVQIVTPLGSPSTAIGLMLCKDLPEQISSGPR